MSERIQYAKKHKKPEISDSEWAKMIDSELKKPYFGKNDPKNTDFVSRRNRRKTVFTILPIGHRHKK